MPTKPIVQFTFATDANYLSGPALGNPTKIIPGDLNQGYVPGDGIVAEWENYLLNICGEWTVWLIGGSSLGAEDAHIVETNSSGATALAALDVTGGAATSTGIYAVGSLGAGPATGVTGQGIAAGPGIDGLGGNGGTSGAGDAFTGGFGVRGFSGTGAGTAGVLGVGNSSGTHAGGLFIGGSSGGRGLEATGVGTSSGALFTGGATNGAGLIAIAGGTAGVGVSGQSNALGTTAGAGVLGTATGDATGVSATATDGYGIVAQSDTTSPTRAALRIIPQNADPSTPAEGDFVYRSDLDELRIYQNSRYQSVWSTPDGRTFGSSSEQSDTNNNAAAYTTLATATLSPPFDPQQEGTVWLWCSAEFGAAGGTIHTTFDVRVRDLTAGVDIWAQTIDHPAAVAGPIFDRPWSIQLRYVLPATGTRNIALQFRIAGGVGSGISARDGGIFVMGNFS